MKNGFAELRYKGKPIIFDENIKTGIIYTEIDEEEIKIVYPNKKDGTPDMRYSICKRDKLLGII